MEGAIKSESSRNLQISLKSLAEHQPSCATKRPNKDPHQGREQLLGTYKLNKAHSTHLNLN